jgi:hypothetical protein
MRRNFRPSVIGLEPRQLLTTIAPPHQLSRNMHTGSIIGGQVTLEAVDAATANGIDVATSTTYTGTGLVKIGGQRVQATITITISDDQTFSMVIDDGQGNSITASGLSLANEEAGNYRITGTTGAWSKVAGTGTWRLATDDDGSAVFSLNPHQ